MSLVHLLDKVDFNVNNYLAFPEREVSLSVKLVKLGRTEYYATKQLISFISAKALDHVRTTMAFIHTVLDKPSSEMKTVKF